MDAGKLFWEYELKMTKRENGEQVTFSDTYKPPRRMTLTVNKDGFVIDTQRGMKVYIDNEHVMFTGASTRDLSLPADNIVELIHNLDLAYKLLIQSRTGDVYFNDQPNLQQVPKIAAGESDEVSHD